MNCQMRSFGVLFASMYANPGGRTRKSLARRLRLGGAATILVASSFASPVYAQAPAGATGAAPGTAPNAPPPPATGAGAGAAPTGTPDVARAPAGGDLPSGSPGALSAESVGQRSMATSYQAKAAEQNLTAAGARAEQQWTNYLPRVGLVARYTRLSNFTPPSITGGGSLVGTAAPPGTLNPTPTAALGGFSFPLVLDNYLTQATIAIPISDYFLRIGKAYSAATRSEDAARFDVVAARARSYADGKVAYYTWLRARGAIGVAEQSLAVARAHQKDAENQFAVGNASKADVLRAQTQVAAAELAVERAKSGAAVTERQVRIAIHGKSDDALVPGETLDAGLPPAPNNLKSLVAEAEGQRPEIKSIDKNAEAARKLADVARAGKYPALSGFGDVTYANPNQRRFPQQEEWFPTWSLGAQITWSPNDVISSGAAGADADARAAALDAQKQATRDGIELEVTQAYQGIVEADAAIASTQRQLESAVEGYRVARELFNNGRGTATTLIDAEIVLAQTRFEHLNARVDARIARIRLDHAVGRDAKMAPP
jgi:outer membrane protein